MENHLNVRKVYLNNQDPCVGHHHISSGACLNKETIKSLSLHTCHILELGSTDTKVKICI